VELWLRGPDGGATPATGALRREAEGSLVEPDEAHGDHAGDPPSFVFADEWCAIE